MFPVKNIMSVKLVTVKPDTPIYEAARLLVDFAITGLPVINDANELVGILSEYDILKLLTESDVQNEQKVKDFMTPKVISFEDTASALDICDFFINNPAKRRVPITHKGKIVGIVTRADIVKLIVGLRHQL